MNTNNRKSFSTANLFFICTIGAFAFKYFYTCWEKTVQSMPLFSNTMLVLMVIIISAWLVLKFPFLVNIEENVDDLSFYDNIYSKNIKFWQRIYSVFFEFTKPSKMISLFSAVILSVGVKNRTCKFSYEVKSPKAIHRFFDVVLTLIFSITALFISKEITKFGIAYGILIYLIVMLNVYKKVILNHIYSVNISKVNGYKLNIICPFNVFEGIFSKLYGLAYDISRTILLSQQVFCGGDNLKKYIIAHEEGHLATKNPQNTFFITLAFVFASFIGIVGPCIALEVCPSKKWIQWFLLVLYLAFLLIFNEKVKEKNKNEELAADVFAIKKIGKDSVLKGLDAIKTDSQYMKSKVKLSKLDINRRIEFVKEYSDT